MKKNMKMTDEYAKAHEFEAVPLGCPECKSFDFKLTFSCSCGKSGEQKELVGIMVVEEEK